MPILVDAATQDFTVKLLYGVTDTDPPTIPTLTSAVPIASDQIDLAWTSATDNYLLSGYVVSRNGTPIATTTLTTFSDTGLTPATTYSYSVVAFDFYNNVSTASNVLATSTLAIPPVVVVATTTPTRPVSSTKTITLANFSASTTAREVTFDWETNFATRYVVRFGRTDLYDGGYIRNDTYRVRHKTEITALEPGTTYVYEITAYAPSGAASVIQKGVFTTLRVPDDEAVLNISRLALLQEGTDVAISYVLPEGVAIDTVRIVRSHLGYPTDGNDGAVVYEGTATNFVDVGALETHGTQFYSVFVVSASGVISSGAVAVITRDSEEVGTPDVPMASSTSSTTDTTVIPLTDLTLNSIIISQLGREVTFLDSTILLSYKDSFTIKIPAVALPKHLKSIVVTLLDPTNQRQSYSFMLRLNKDQTAYEAMVAPLYVRGVSRLQIQIFDYDRMVVGLYRKQIDFVILDESTEPEVVFPDALVSSARNTLWPGLFALIASLGLILFFTLRRHRRAEDNT